MFYWSVSLSRMGLFNSPRKILSCPAWLWIKTRLVSLSPLSSLLRAVFLFSWGWWWVSWKPFLRSISQCVGVQKQKWRKRQRGGEKNKRIKEARDDDDDDLKGGQERRERADGLLDVQSVSTPRAWAVWCMDFSSINEICLIPSRRTSQRIWFLCQDDCSAWLRFEIGTHSGGSGQQWGKISVLAATVRPWARGLIHTVPCVGIPRGRFIAQRLLFHRSGDIMKFSDMLNWSINSFISFGEIKIEKSRQLLTWKKFN